MPHRRILHARFVFPVSGEPIENGFVVIEDGRIADIGKTPPSGARIDLGNFAILPGFINAHTHLEFSGLSQPLGTPGMGFVDWIREVIEWRGGHRLDVPGGLLCPDYLALHWAIRDFISSFEISLPPSMSRSAS